MRNNSHGFTVLEISIVMMIAGILLIPLLDMYRIHQKQALLARENEKITDASVALNKFVLENNRYPCPADRSLPPEDLNYGREITPCPTIANLPLPNTCDTRICKTIGRDRHTASPGGDNVLVGVLPFAELGLSLNDVITYEGDKITYAVSERMTDASTFDNYEGAIHIADDFGVTLTNTDDDPGAHFVVVSHGANRKGAYAKTGEKIANCAGAGRDNENCNDDYKFMQAKLSHGEGAGYYDDILQYSTNLSSGIWSLTGSGGENIMSTNTGNIGVGINNPQEKLDVNGNVRVSGKVLSGKLCNTDGTKCFDPLGIAGDPPGGAAPPTSIYCPSGQVIKGFNLGTGDCTTPNLTTPIPAQSCPASKPYITGINSDGTIVCGT